MEQLELFPNDIVRFATELSHAELQALRDRSYFDYGRICSIRRAFEHHRRQVKDANKKLDIEIINIIGGRYV